MANHDYSKGVCDEKNNSNNYHHWIYEFDDEL